MADAARSRPSKPIVPSRPSSLPSSSPTAVVAGLLSRRSRASTHAAVRRHAVPRTDVTVRPAPRLWPPGWNEPPLGFPRSFTPRRQEPTGHAGVGPGHRARTWNNAYDISRTSNPASSLNTCDLASHRSVGQCPASDPMVVRVLLVRGDRVTAVLWLGLCLFSSVYFSLVVISHSRVYGTIGVVFIF